MALQTQVYSVGDFTKGGVTNGYILDLILTEESYDIRNNTSQVGYTLQLRSGGSNRFTSSNFWCKVNIAGQEYTANPQISAAYHYTYFLLGGTVTVTHEADGSLNLPWSAAMWNGRVNEYAPYDTVFSGDMPLTNIPRASTIKATDANIGSVATVTVLSNSPSFTHTVAYHFGNLTGYLNENGETVSDPVYMTALSIPFSIPESFYTQIPNDPSGYGTLTCVTYSGQTQIGQAQSCKFTATTNKDLCAPGVLGDIKDVNIDTLKLTGDEKALVKYRSTAHCLITAWGVNGASITGISIDGKHPTDCVLEIPQVQETAIDFTAWDSRGYSSTCQDPSVRMIDYIPLSNLAWVSRDDPTSGNATITVCGSYWDGNFGLAENYLRITYRIDGGEWIEPGISLDIADGKYSGTIALSGLDYTKSYRIEVVATDALTQLGRSMTVQKGMPVFDWGENDFAFHVPVTGVDIQAPVGGVRMGTVDVWDQNRFSLQTKFHSIGEDSSWQSIFLFGNCNYARIVHGILGINGDGATIWDGSEGVQVSPMDYEGKITVELPTYAYDRFVLISPQDFSII